MSRLSEQRASTSASRARLPWWRQLRWGLALYFVLLVVVPIVVVVFLTFNQSQQTAEEQSLNQLESVAELKTQEIDRWVQDAQQSLRVVLAGQPRVNRFVELAIPDTPEIGNTARTALSIVLIDAAQQYAGVTEYFFYDVNDGRILVSSDTDRVGQVVRAKPYFEASKAGPYVQSPYYEITNELNMVITEPVKTTSGVTVGVLAARMNLDALTNIMLARAGLGDTGETYLVSAESNFFLTESRFEDVEETRAYHSLGIDRALAGQNGSGAYDDYRDEQVFGVYRWLPDLQSALIAEIDQEEALADYNRTQNLVTLITIILAGAAAILGIWVATRFTRPVNALVETASQLAAGDLNQRADLRTRNELGVLAGTFNDMANQLQDLIDSLEGRVQARTRDLFLTLEIGQLASRIYRMDELLPRVTEYIREQFDLYYTQVYLNDEAGRYAVLVAGTGEVGRQLLQREHRLDLGETSIVARTVQTRRPVLVADTEASSVFRPNPLLPETRSEVAIPLIVGGDVLGVLDMQARDAETFREDNLPVFEAMASQLASAIRSAEAYAETEAAVERATAINRRLTTDMWQSYLGRLGRGDRVGYSYNLREVEPVAEPMEIATTSAQSGNGHDGNRLARPVKVGAQSIGQIVLAEDRQREWTDDDLELIDDVAERVALALEQFRAFDETRAALDRVDLILGAVGEGIYGLDRDGLVTFVNQEASAMDGYEPGELIGQHHHSLMHHTHRDGTPYPEDECPINATLQDGQVRVVDYEIFWRKDGTSFPVELSSSPVIQDGEIVGAVVSFRDISERLAAQEELAQREQQFRAVFEAANDAIFLLRPEDGVFVDWNARTLMYFGAEPADLVGKTPGDFSPEIQLDGQPSGPKAAAVIAKAAAGEPQVFEWLHRRKDGTEFFAEVSLSRIEVRGEVLTQAVIRDITERVEAEAERERLLQETQRRAAEMETVAEVGAQASASLDVENLLWTVADLTKERFDLYHAHIYLIDEDGEYLLLHAGAGDPGRMMVRAGHRIPLDHERSVVAHAARSRQAVVVDDVTGTPDFLPNPLLPLTRSEMAVPMVVGERLIGVLDVQADIPSRFKQEDMQVQTTLASQIAVAINNARQFTETEASQNLLRTIIDTSPDWIFAKDTEYRYLLVNESFAEFYGGRTPQEMEGLDDYDLGTPVELIEGNPEKGIVGFRPDDSRAVEGGETVFNPNDVVQFADGSIHILETTKLPLRDADGNIIGMLGLSRDVTQQREAQQERERLFAETERRAAEMATVAEVGAEASASLDIENLLWEVTDLTRQRFGLYHAHIYLLDEAGGTLVLHAGSGQPGRQMVEAGHRINLNHERSIVAHAARSRQPVVVDNVTSAEDFLPNPLLPKTRSEMAIPMVVGERLIGVLDVQSDIPSRFTDEDVQVKSTLAAQIAVAVNNARLFFETERRATDMATVAEVGAQASATLDVENLLWEVADLSKQRFNLYHAHIYLLDEAGTNLVLRAGSGEPGRKMVQARHRITLSHERSLVARAARTRQPVVTDDVTASPDFLPNPLLPHTRSEMAIPMVVGDRLIGVLDVQADVPSRFTDDDVQVQTTLASQIAVAVNNARLFNQVEQTLVQTELLYNASRRITEAPGAPELVAAVVESVPLPGVNRALLFVYDYDEDGNPLNTRVGANWHTGEGAPPSEIGRTYSLEDYPTFRLMLGADPVLMPDALNDERVDPNLLEVMTEQEIRALAAVPLWAGGRHLGALFIESQIAQEFDPEDIRLMQALTGQMAVALDSLQLLDQTQRRASEMETVARVGAEASTSLEPDRLLQSVVDLTKDRFGLYHVHVYLFDDLGQNLVLAAGSGDAGRLMASRGHRIPANREGSVVARAARTREAVIVNDVRQATEFLPNPLLPATRSEMAIPMIVGREIIGVLDVQSDVPNRFTAEDVQVKTTLASQVSVAINNARLYAEQVQVADRLREVDRLKSEFLASMSHELRTPLNSIIGYAEVLLDGIDGELTEDMNEDVNAIHGSGKHLLNLINDILDLAKIEAGQMDLVTEPLDLQPLVEDVASTNRVLLKDKPVALNLDVAGDLPQIEADPLRLRQVISNLMTNASKFTEDGSITIWAQPYAKDPSMIHIGVTDTGIGMNEHQVAVIFDRFRQVDQSHTRRAGGTGLGLSITLQLVQLHGGDIWVESEPGVGSTFHFTLPFATEDAPA